MTITEGNLKRNVAVDVLCAALSVPRATYYRHQIKKENVIKEPALSKNALEKAEKKIILDLLHSERFVDKTAYQVLISTRRGPFQPQHKGPTGTAA
jgi:hypothetical protein